MYVYGFAYVVRVLGTITSFAGKTVYLYVYGLCAVSDLCVRIRLLSIKRLMLQGLFDSFDVAMMSCWMLSDSLDVAMTVGIDVIQFVRRIVDRRDGCSPIRPT